MSQAIVDGVARAVVARRYRNSDAHGRGGGERLLHLLHGRGRPGALGAAPANRDDRWLAAGVVHGGSDSINKTLVGVGSEIHGNASTGSELPPRTSMSNITSPSGPFGLPGLLLALSTLTAWTAGNGMPNEEK